MGKYERQLRRNIARAANKQYAMTHSPKETVRHVTARRYSSGRPSYGGANRSSNIRREIGLRVTTVTLCVTCGGVTAEIAALTSLFPLCSCRP
jgi:hypothetical protein